MATILEQFQCYNSFTSNFEIQR
uniref:Uncharacterized protein n=1 Tax=Onchocerca volvulus TaxID=6282 RepID=A0A2K6VMB5_ONCVO